jgi:hypothetical protein
MQCLNHRRSEKAKSQNGDNYAEDYDQKGAEQIEKNAQYIMHYGKA